PSSAIAPQPAQRARAPLSSSENTSPSNPAAALPSILRSPSSISASSRSESFRLDAQGIVAQPNESFGHALDEPRRTADEDVRPLARRPRDLAEQLAVDAPRVAVPARGLRAGQRVHDVQAVVLRGETAELLAV